MKRLLYRTFLRKPIKLVIGALSVMVWLGSVPSYGLEEPTAKNTAPIPIIVMPDDCNGDGGGDSCYNGCYFFCNCGDVGDWGGWGGDCYYGWGGPGCGGYW